MNILFKYVILECVIINTTQYFYFVFAIHYVPPLALLSARQPPYRNSKSFNFQYSHPPFGKGRFTINGTFFCANSSTAIK